MTKTVKSFWEGLWEEQKGLMFQLAKEKQDTTLTLVLTTLSPVLFLSFFKAAMPLN